MTGYWQLPCKVLSRMAKPLILGCTSIVCVVVVCWWRLCLVRLFSYTINIPSIQFPNSFLQVTHWHVDNRFVINLAQCLSDSSLTRSNRDQCCMERRELGSYPDQPFWAISHFYCHWSSVLPRPRVPFSGLYTPQIRIQFELNSNLIPTLISLPPVIMAAWVQERSPRRLLQ